MSRSVRIRKPRWTKPEDRAYLSFLGTLLHSLRMERVRMHVPGFQLVRRASRGVDSGIPSRNLFPVPDAGVALPDSQADSIKAVAWAAKQSGFEPKALPGPSEMLTIDMVKTSDGEVPVYERRAE